MAAGIQRPGQVRFYRRIGVVLTLGRANLLVMAVGRDPEVEMLDRSCYLVKERLRRGREELEDEVILQLRALQLFQDGGCVVLSRLQEVADDEDRRSAEVRDPHDICRDQ